MNGYLLDTNIVTAHLKKNPLVQRRLRNAEIAGHPVMLNAISYYETRRGLLFAGAHGQLRAFEQLWQVLGKESMSCRSLADQCRISIQISCRSHAA